MARGLEPPSRTCGPGVGPQHARSPELCCERVHLGAHQDLLLFFPITTACILGCFVFAYRRYGKRSALVLALAGWGIELALLAAPLLSYSVQYSVKADLFVGASLVATTVGYLLVRKPSAPAPPVYPHRGRERLFAQVLCALGMLGCCMLLLDAQARGISINPASFLTNLAQVRETAIDPFRQGSAMFEAGTILTGCGYLGMLGAVKLGRGGGRRLVLLAGVTFALIAAASLLALGGRTIVFNAALLLGVGVYLGDRSLAILRPRRVLVGLVVMLSIWFFGVSYFETRENGVNVQSYLAELHHAKPRSWLRPLMENNDAVGVGLVSLGYFTSPLPILTWYTEQEPLPGRYWGTYSFPLVSRAVRKAAQTNAIGEWTLVREEIFEPLEAGGYPGNVWVTWLRDLLVEYGYLGAVLFCALAGGFMAWARNRFEATGALHYHYLEAVACFTLAFGAFQNLMWVNVYSAVFFIALGVMVASRVTVGGHGRGGVPGRYRRDGLAQ